MLVIPKTGIENDARCRLSQFTVGARSQDNPTPAKGHQKRIAKE